MRLTYVHLMSFAATLGDRAPKVFEVSDWVTPDWVFYREPAFKPVSKKQASERSRQASQVAPSGLPAVRGRGC